MAGLLRRTHSFKRRVFQCVLRLLAFSQIFDETQSWFGEGSGEADLKYAVNGRIYGNNDAFTMARGQRVRWYLLASGDQVRLPALAPRFCPSFRR